MSRPGAALVLVRRVLPEWGSAEVRYLETVDGLRQAGDVGVVELADLPPRPLPGHRYRMLGRAGHGARPREGGGV